MSIFNQSGFVKKEIFDLPVKEQVLLYQDEVDNDNLLFLPPEPNVELLDSLMPSEAKTILARSAEYTIQVEHDPDDQLGEKVLQGLFIPAGMEMIQLTFGITCCSRVFSHQMVRHRLASIAQSNSRDRILPPIFVLPFDPKDAVNVSRLKKAKERCTLGYMNYLLDVLNGEEPQNARYFMPECIAQSMVFCIDFKSLQAMCSNRLCVNMQPEMSFVAWRMKQLVEVSLGKSFSQMLRPTCDKIKKCLPVQCNTYDCCGKWPSSIGDKGLKPYSQIAKGDWEKIRAEFFAERG